jgi:hypothetical protein
VTKKPVTEFIVICQSIVGNPECGYDTSYDWDRERFKTRKAAIKHGMKVRDSDDFNIGVLTDGKLTQFCWMEEVLDYPLDEVSERIYLQSGEAPAPPRERVKELPEQSTTQEPVVPSGFDTWARENPGLCLLLIAHTEAVIAYAAAARAPLEQKIERLNSVIDTISLNAEKGYEIARAALAGNATDSPRSELEKWARITVLRLRIGIESSDPSIMDVWANDLQAALYGKPEAKLKQLRTGEMVEAKDLEGSDGS